MKTKHKHNNPILVTGAAGAVGGIGRNLTEFLLRVNMWGTSLPEDKLAGDLGNVIGATSIGGRRRIFFTARKLAQGNLGLLQQSANSGLVQCN